MENENPPSVPADLNELQEQCAWLRKQIVTILVLVLCTSGALNVFLLRQWRYTSTDLKAMKEQMPANFPAVVAEYQKTLEPNLEKIIRNVQEYGRTHPDFQPIMTKYRLSTSAPPATTAPPKK